MLAGHWLVATLAIQQLHCTLAANVIMYLHPVANSHCYFTKSLERPLMALGHSVTTLHTPMADYAESVPANISAIDTAPEVNGPFEAMVNALLWSKELSLLHEYVQSYRVSAWLQKTCRTFTTGQWMDRLRALKPDFMIIDTIFLLCAHLLPQQLDLPYAVTLGVTPPTYISTRQGHPVNPSIVVSQLRGFSPQMSLMQRVLNTADLLGAMVYEDLMLVHGTREMRTVHKPNHQMWYTHMNNITYNVVNDETDILSPRPHIPTIYFGGGMNMLNDEPPDLEMEFQDFVNSAPRGVILISFSTMAKPAYMPESFKKTIIEMIKSMPEYHFIWRMERKIGVVQKLRNVKIVDWLPFRSLLRTGKVVSVLMHGGINSALEVVRYGVPAVGMPLYGDQPSVVAKIEHAGVGVALQKHEFNFPNLIQAVKKTLNSQKIRNRVRALARMMVDRPVTRLHEASQLIHSAIKRKGISYHKLKSTELHSTVIACLDIAAFALLIVQIVKFSLAL